MFRHRFEERRRQREVRAVVREAKALRPRLCAALAKTDDPAVLCELVRAIDTIDNGLRLWAPNETTPSIITDLEEVR